MEKELEREMKWEMRKWSCSRPLWMMEAWTWWRCSMLLQDLRRVKMVADERGGEEEQC